MDVEKMNFDQLTELYKQAEAKIEAIEKTKAPYKEALKELETLLTQRLHDSGATSIATPHGTVHTVGKTTAKIMDPQLFREYIINGNLWDGIDWKANMSWCRSTMEQTKMEIPGVQLSTYRYLSITAPRPAKRTD